jgi:hypothetical protein
LRVKCNAHLTPIELQVDLHARKSTTIVRNRKAIDLNNH